MPFDKKQLQTVVNSGGKFFYEKFFIEQSVNLHIM
jgi:hypothetical protein